MCQKDFIRYTKELRKETLKDPYNPQDNRFQEALA